MHVDLYILIIEFWVLLQETASSLRSGRSVGRFLTKAKSFRHTQRAVRREACLQLLHCIRVCDCMVLDTLAQA